MPSKRTPTAKPSKKAGASSAAKPARAAEIAKSVSALKDLHYPTDAKKARWSIPRLRTALAVFEPLDYGEPHGNSRAMGDVGLIRALHLAGQTAEAKQCWGETVERWNAAKFEGYNWRTIAELQGQLEATLPRHQRDAARTAWARSILSSEQIDKKPNGRVPKDPQDAYQQAHAELMAGNFTKAKACLDVARTDEDFSSDCELLDIFIAHSTGEREKARAAYARAGERAKDFSLYELLAAVGVLIGDDTQKKRILTAWKRASPNDAAWSIFAS